MAEVTNYLGKLMELGAKSKFVVDPKVTEAHSGFKCTIQIKSYDIMVEKVGNNKKAAKANAAQAAFEQICQKINETNAASLDKIASKLTDLEISSDKVSTFVEFAKKLASLDVSKVNVNNGNSYSELNDLISEIQCTLSYKHDENKTTNGTATEFQFVCEVRPNGLLSPAVNGYGWSSESLEEAKTKAVTQLLTIIGTFANQ